jgi:5-methylcytosine-specific restriction endonuclease McrA
MPRESRRVAADNAAGNCAATKPAKEEEMSHRDPPLPKRPPFVVECDEREKRNGAGYCKVCEKLIPKADGTPHLGRLYCSNKCKRRVEDAWWQYSPNHLSELVMKRDQGKCAICGETKKIPYEYRSHDMVDGKWQTVTKTGYNSDIEIDHIKALCLLNDEERKDLYWWGLDNLQTLCHACHVAKTRDDMAKLRQIRRRTPDELFAPTGEPHA